MKNIVISLEQQNKADAQIKEKQRQIDYDTKDFTIELLITKFKKNEFFIPKYQRKYIWKENNKNLFLESVFLGLPIPFMFLAECTDGKQEIIDGAQRMQTLVEFCCQGHRLAGMEKITELNGFTFNDLSESQKRKFLNKTLRIIVLEENTPDSSRQDLFKRINTTGVKATDSEIRRGSYPGKLTKFIENCSNNQKFKKLAPMSTKNENRYERFEFILRFFAYVNEYKKFKHRVNVFLDNFLRNNLENFDLKTYQKDFDNMLEFVEKNFKNGFAKTPNANSTPRVRFEAISVGTALALKEKPKLTIKNVDWLDSKEFQELTTSDASNNQGKLRARIEYVKEHLLKGE